MKLYIRLFKYKKIANILILLLISSMMSQCVDPFEIETESFESILIINTTMTDEVKHQKVLLSRTFRFEDSIPPPENGAAVKVIEGSGVEYLFSAENQTPGTYISEQEFAIQPDKEYTLSIKTSDGRSYISDKASLPQQTSIENVYAKQITNDQGVEGVGIFVTTFDPTGNSKYYRYEYEETFRFEAPFWVETDVRAIKETNEEGEDEISFVFEVRPLGERICYRNDLSNEIIITDTNDFSEDRLTDFLFRFIPAEDVKVADRYSILVKQLVQSREANEFYETLNNFSESESLFSQVQPGFIRGNIVSETNPDEKVLGYFEISSIATERIFFNRGDILREELPSFELECFEVTIAPAPFEPEEDFRRRLRAVINSNRLKFLVSVGGSPGGSVFTFVPRQCGDCTALGKSDPPDFWVE
ncbi:DUF4249 domain-containing protein [Aquimarina sp. 2304DJ70-9]|uniref:DUF4249 domain-containing protein n=1 Tax=Aquimarina penaris TaxID=3231044 RepID=UPI00346267C8